MCIFTGNSDKILMGTNILFCASCIKTVKHVYMNLNDREAVWICFWQWISKCYTNLTIINRIIGLLPIFDYDFLSDCPSLMHGIGIHYVQHFQAMLERGVCELAHSFLSWGRNYRGKIPKRTFSSVEVHRKPFFQLNRRYTTIILLYDLL